MKQYVIKNVERNQYLKRWGGMVWTHIEYKPFDKIFTDDISLARVYGSKGSAKVSLNTILASLIYRRKFYNIPSESERLKRCNSEYKNLDIENKWKILEISICAEESK